MTIPAGQRRHRIKFQSLVQATDPDYGGPIGDPEWSDVATTYAKRTNTLRETAEAVAAGSTIAPVQVRFDMNARHVDSAWRIVGVGGDHDGVIYDIKNVGTSNDGSETAVIAISGANNG